MISITLAAPTHATAIPTRNRDSLTALGRHLDAHAKWPSRSRPAHQIEAAMAVMLEVGTSTRTRNGRRARGSHLKSKPLCPSCSRLGRQIEAVMAVVHEVWASTCGPWGGFAWPTFTKRWGCRASCRRSDIVLQGQERADGVVSAGEAPVRTRLHAAGNISTN